jgi:hypothetical protein
VQREIISHHRQLADKAIDSHTFGVQREYGLSGKVKEITR